MTHLERRIASDRRNRLNAALAAWAPHGAIDRRAQVERRLDSARVAHWIARFDDARHT